MRNTPPPNSFLNPRSSPPTQRVCNQPSHPRVEASLLKRGICTYTQRHTHSAPLPSVSALGLQGPRALSLSTEVPQNAHPTPQGAVRGREHNTKDNVWASAPLHGCSGLVVHCRLCGLHPSPPPPPAMPTHQQHPWQNVWKCIAPLMGNPSGDCPNLIAMRRTACSLPAPLPS